MSEQSRAGALSADDILDSLKSTIFRIEPRDTSEASNSDTPPLVAAEVSESIGESFAALSKVAQVDDGAPEGPATEYTMDAIQPGATIRPLSQIEQDLLAAEAEFSDAEARRQRAEADARTALRNINNYQAEIDAAIARLRQISPAGSNWSRQADLSSNVLTLKEEAPSGDPVVRPNFSYSAKS